MVLWWQWLIAGMVILATDAMLINSYYLLWLGLAAVLTGIAVSLFPDSVLWQQAVIFSVLALVLLVLAVRFRPVKNYDKVREEIRGKQAIVVDWFENRGHIRLQAPIGGSDKWKFRSEEPFKPGDTAIVDDFDVKKHIAIIKKTS